MMHLTDEKLTTLANVLFLWIQSLIIPFIGHVVSSVKYYDCDTLPSQVPVRGTGRPNPSR